MRLSPATLLLCALAATATADGGDHRGHHGHRDHDRAHEALRRGEIAPLAEIMPAVELQLGGRVIDMELGRDDGRLIYTFELIAPDGRILEAEVDALTGVVIEVEAAED